MKKFIAIIMTLVSTVAFADSMFDGMSKEELSQYEILVIKHEPGKPPQTVGVMSRAEYKVVRVESSPSVELPDDIKAIANNLMRSVRQNEVIARKYREGYNTVILHAGAGKDGLEYKHGSNYEVSEHDSFVAGVTGCRAYEGKGLCASAFSNKTFTLGVKFDF